ncbi:hypothetical protein [Nocardioides iriomotensis]|uniref:Uncharacterized protein n=1 Tax=Nocardioides iriomotensis TaxID=715784 RepID=A0A4Q5J6Y0_9ACTN|nr:hypothetical protein [Nocardioides iriomotensis]RYU13481.1 hypothetical protein ETU37_06540 [Nocardioides iriomotensis]
MIDDDVMTRLVEFHDHIQAPAASARLDALRGEQLVRRRRTVWVVAAAAAVVLVLGITQAALPGSHRTVQPANKEWTPERIRTEGALDFAGPTTNSGPTVHVYAACGNAPCNNEGDNPDLIGVPFPLSKQWENAERALQVTSNGRSAVFEAAGGGEPFGISTFTEDSVLVTDWPVVDGRVPPTPRYRLLNADGTDLLLRIIDEPVPARPGPDVVVHDLQWARGGWVGLYVIDQDAATLRPLDLPSGVGVSDNPRERATQSRYWGPNVDEFLWGVDDDCRIFWQTDSGAFTQHRLGCRDDGNFIGTVMNPAWFPDGWLRPGRMAAAEQRVDGLVLHVTLDYGATWQRLPLRSDNDLDGLPTSTSPEVVERALN